MTTIRARLNTLQTSIANERPDLLVATGRALLVGFLVFTFVSGLVYTVIPLMKAIGTHLYVNVWLATVNWIWAEPRYGALLVSLLSLTGLAMLVYLTRRLLFLAVLFVVAWAVSLRTPMPSALKSRPKSRYQSVPQAVRRNEPDTAIVGG